MAKTKTRKILEMIIIYAAIIGIFALFFPNEWFNIIAAITSGGVTVLLQSISILQAKSITKPILSTDLSIQNKASIRVFKPEPQPGLIILVIFFLGVISWRWSENSSLLEKIAISVVYGLFIISILFSVYFQTLVFSNEGIQYINILGKTDVPWINILEIVETGLGANFLVARDVSYSGLWKRKISEYEIPLSFFQKKWKEGEIGIIIKQNANLEFIDK